MKKVVIVNKMIAEYDEDGVTPDEALFAHQDRSKVFATMKAAKKHIENDVAENYTGSDRYVVKDVIRLNKDGAWLVTVYYDGGRVEYHAAEVEIPEV